MRFHDDARADGRVMDVTKVGEVAGNAAVAVVEVSKAVRMRGVEAPDVQKSFVAKGGAEVDRGGPVAVDEEGSARLRQDRHPGLLG